LTAVAQWAKAPGIHCYVAGSIPAVTPRYCTKKIEKCSLEHKKNKVKKKIVSKKNQASICRKMHGRGSGMCGEGCQTESGSTAN
jgi:hypothetical protein